MQLQRDGVSDISVMADDRLSVLGTSWRIGQIRLSLLSCLATAAVVE
jgi:hypothetical protein